MTKEREKRMKEAKKTNLLARFQFVKMIGFIACKTVCKVANVSNAIAIANLDNKWNLPLFVRSVVVLLSSNMKLGAIVIDLTLKKRHFPFFLKQIVERILTF